MATAPNVYTNFTPSINVGGLSPLQLAGLNFMLAGSPAPFAVNPEFLAAARVFASSEIQTPLGFDVLTGKAKPPDLLRDVSGIAYYVRGDDVYLYRKAQDCGPDENRYEEVWIGKTYDIAKGTYAYYGNRVQNGTYGTGSGYVFDTGSYLSTDAGPPPAPADLGINVDGHGFNAAQDSVTAAGAAAAAAAAGTGVDGGIGGQNSSL